MALIVCYECGKEISDRANACPYCGAPAKLRYEINENGVEVWYDRKGKLVHSLTEEAEVWFENEKPVYAITLVNGVKVEQWLDENGKINHAKLATGDECWCEYDAKGNKIHDKWSNGLEHWYKNKKNIHTKWPDGTETWYDKDGNEIEKKE